MTERPILFSGPMVRAILEGRKTQTRRQVKPVRGFEHHNIPEYGLPHAADPWAVWWHSAETDRVGCLQECPYGKPGDRLWVREAWRTGSTLDKWSGKTISEKALEVGYYRQGSTNPCCPLYYEADGKHREWSDYDVQDFGEPGRYRHARFMPRWASRITLEIVSVRVECLNEISEEDARAEGVEFRWSNVTLRSPFGSGACRHGFEKLWQSINGPGTFDDRWVWVVEFKVLEGQG